MSDENLDSGATPPPVPPADGAFDWLRESHQQSAPLAPLSDDIPTAAPAPLTPPVASTPSAAEHSELPPAWTPAPAAVVTNPVQAPQYEAATTPAVPPPLAPPPAPTPPTWAIAQQPPAASPASAEPQAAPAWSPTPPPVAATPPAWDSPQRPSAVTPPAWTPTEQLAVHESAAASEAQLPPRPSFMSAPYTEPAAVTSDFAASPVGLTPATAVADAPGNPAFALAGSAPSAADTVPESLSPSAFGIAGLGLERHEPVSRSGNGPLDWVAFILAFIAPPLGIIAGIVAIVVGTQTKGFATGIAKAAIAIGVVLSIILTVGLIVVGKLNSEQAAHDAVVASSRPYCAKLQSNPATLASDTYGWPSPGTTIPTSITSIQAYVTYWTDLKAIAPKGIKDGTGQIASAAQSILTSVQKTQTLDDASNVSDMEDAVASSGVPDWVSEYCK